MQSISVALTEIFMGVLAGNFLGVKTTPWIGFLASFGSVLPGSLADAEIDPQARCRRAATRSTRCAMGRKSLRSAHISQAANSPMAAPPRISRG